MSTESNKSKGQITEITALRRLKGDEAARKVLVRAVVKANGSKYRAAAALGLAHQTFYRLLRELGAHDEIDAALAANGIKVRRGRPRRPLDSAIADGPIVVA